MDTEIEAKFLNIDKNKLRKLLKNIGAELVQPERIMQRAAEVAALADELGFQMEKAYYGSVEIVYQQDFDVTEDEINFMPEIKFKKIPAWLEARRKKTTKKE